MIILHKVILYTPAQVYIFENPGILGYPQNLLEPARDREKYVLC